MIGGVAPSEYLTKLEKGDQTNPAIDSETLDGYLRSHMINPALLRSDQFEAFMIDRQKQLLSLIEHATGKTAYVGTVEEEGEEIEIEGDNGEVDLTIPAV